MHKKIIALAVAGLASSAAFAQTNVTVYGVVDVGQAWVKGDAQGNNPDQKTVGRLDSNSSLIGFKGVEDLGNGLKAVFLYETNLKGDDNAVGLNGGRDSYVGLTGGFGTVVAGHLTHPLRAWGARVDILPGAAGFGTVAAVTGAINGIKTGADERAKNAIAYVSPSFGGGFSATVAYVNGERRTDDATLTVNPAGDVTGNQGDVNSRAWQVSGQYDNGPLFVGIGYHKAYSLPLTSTTLGLNDFAEDGQDARIIRVAAQYTAPFGTKFSALYDDTKVETGDVGQAALGVSSLKRKAWSIGAMHAFGANTIGLQYARSGETQVSGAADLDDKARIWTAAYSYALSKRTMLHARYSVLKNDDEGNFQFYLNPVSGNGVNVGNGAEYTGFMVALRHTF